MTKKLTKRKDDARSKDLAKILADVTKSMGREVIKTIGDSLMSEVKIWIPTGVPAVDLLLGGGLPVGKVVEFYGKEKCGKSTMALQACIEARKLGGMVIYIDTEHTINKERAEYIGLNLNDNMVMVLEPSNFEEGFRTIYQLLEKVKVEPSLQDIPFFLIIWDTLAFTASETEFDEKGEFKHDMGKRAGRMRQYMRRLLEDCARSNICFVNLNHETENLSNTNAKVKSHSVPGGTAFKFACSLQVRMSPVNSTKEKILTADESDQLGLPVNFKLVHTRLSPAKREIKVPLNFYSGFDGPLSVVWYLKDAGVLDRKGNNYIVNIPGRDQILISTGSAGEKKFIDLYKKDEEFRTFVLQAMKSHYEKIVPWKNPDGYVEDGIAIDVADEFQPPAFKAADEEEEGAE